MSKYTHQQRVEILKVCLDLADEKLTRSSAEDKIHAISSDYPLHTVQIEVSRLKKYLSGEATYGYGYAATWAKALLELTNRNPKVIAALKAQQRIYLEKDGKTNKQIGALLNQING